ncbi:hypothetical protein CWB99_06660 [Pseudoalteromonas rubra]|uniref:Cardiolipin synthase N-terminal domain-containing protein n=1 Tax=Pseudoalteromonas rubra TaxID=43658 RepID=A0A5S3WQL0_9GAMM|nr:hypothetical protein ELR70_19695 [Pseudoalteromonas sp. R3]TMP30446.1 hypothetical protein CWB99_06660 [Pseudoalteromonas rubra]TMP35468.1 hypothetical protein CWC00_04720 [Pseudoalteromonas rubra]
MSVWQLLITPVLLSITILPVLMALFSKQTSRTQKIVWCLLSFMFSWVGYLSYYFLVVRSLGKDNT